MIDLEIRARVGETWRAMPPDPNASKRPRLLPPQESGWSNGTDPPMHRHRDGRVGIRLSLCYGCGRVTIGSELHSCRCGEMFAETTVAEVWPTPLELIL